LTRTLLRSYTPAITLTAAACLLAAVSVFLIRRPKLQPT
jgi:hypothetical protein